MPLIVPDAAEAVFVLATVKGEAPDPPRKIRLFKNDLVPDAETVIGDVTPADFDGAAAITLDPDEWQSPVNVGGRAETQYGTVAQQWTNGGGASQTVYGYYCTNEAGDVLLWVERFSAPIDVAPAGVVEVLPKFTLRSEY